MRLLIHDFAGHPFQVQLSRELALRGHEVAHVYPIGLAGPKGRLEGSVDDHAGFQIIGVQLPSWFRKYSPSRRFLAHRKYAADLKKLISERHVDAVLSGNTPIDIQAELLWYSKRRGIRFVHWVQDVYCYALEFVLRRRVGVLAKALAFPFLQLERHVARRSNANIVIADAFRDVLTGWGVETESIAVCENWAPLDEMPSLPKDNAWSQEHGLVDKTVFLYSGTLGLKHRPDLLYHLAASLDDSCRVVVISEGVGRRYLERQPKLNNLVLLDFQPYDRVPYVLASADILVATLEAGAAEFAVPSKILTYMCAGRTILLAAPLVNLAASIVQRSGAGSVVDPNNSDEFIQAAERLASDECYRLSSGLSARRYAENVFDIGRIAERFERVLISNAGQFVQSDVAATVSASD